MKSEGGWTPVPTGDELGAEARFLIELGTRGSGPERTEATDVWGKLFSLIS